jgi:hypothetical protein
MLKMGGCRETELPTPPWPRRHPHDEQDDRVAHLDGQARAGRRLRAEVTGKDSSLCALLVASPCDPQPACCLLLLPLA